MVEQVEKRAKQKLVVGWGGNTNYEGLAASPEVSTEIMTNNVRVTIMAVGLGVTAGIGTGYVLIMNGLMLGGLAGVATNYSVDYLFWSVILPHGILELTAICIAGGAGLVIARAIYAPGDLPRRDALRIAGGEAGQLLAGVAAMLVLAGFIEGFITPTTLPPGVKIGFALLTGVFMSAYLMVRPKTA
ncbi:stage II sporulation protein M [bacterium]|nr:MAG: stage II sporulation protein M [bacterium]